MDISGIGVWNAGLLSGDPAEVADAVAELEESGYTSVWIPGFGTGSFDAVERLLSATTTMTVATGILNIWFTAADETAAAWTRLRDAHGDRFLLGLGVSHAPLLARIDENLRYERPLSVMSDYLDGLDAASGARAVGTAGGRGARTQDARARGAPVPAVRIPTTSRPSTPPSRAPRSAQESS